MSMLRSSFKRLFRQRLPFLRMIFYEELDMPDEMFEGIFNMITSDRIREQMSGLTGFGLPYEKDENDPLVYDDILPAYDKTFEHVTYALGFQISKEAKADDIDGPLQDLTRALARSMRTGKARYVWNVFNNAFTTETTPDGKAVFASDHPFVEGPAAGFSNLVSADLSISSLQTAINIFDDMRDHRNLEVTCDPAQLLFPNELRWIVGEILGSPDRPDTANRSINVMQGILTPKMIRWLTGPDDWFVMASPGQHSLYLLNRQDDEFDADVDFDTKAAKESCDHRHSEGWADWRGAVGGQGQ